MSRKNKILLVIGLLLIGSAIFLIASQEYMNKKMQADILSIAQNSIVLDEDTELDDTESNLDKPIQSTEDYTDLEAIIEADFNAVTEDQKVKKVKEYKNVLEIPQYNILAHIYDDVSQTSLHYGVGHYPQTVEVGEKGNCCIAGHSSVIYDCILNEVKNFKMMDSFFVYDKKGKKHTYYVQDMYVVDPTAMYVLDTVDFNRSQFTMITCTNGGTQRLVITSVELNKKDLDAYFKELYKYKYGYVNSLFYEYTSQLGLTTNNLVFEDNSESQRVIYLKKESKAWIICRYIIHNDLKTLHNLYNLKYSGNNTVYYK